MLYQYIWGLNIDVCNFGIQYSSLHNSEYAFTEYILILIMVAVMVDVNWFRGTHWKTKEEWDPRNCQEPESRKQEAVKQNVKWELLWQIHTHRHIHHVSLYHVLYLQNQWPQKIMVQVQFCECWLDYCCSGFRLLVAAVDKQVKFTAQPCQSYCKEKSINILQAGPNVLPVL